MKVIDRLNPVNFYYELNRKMLSGVVGGAVSNYFFYKNGQPIKNYNQMKWNYDNTVEEFSDKYPGMSIEEKLVEIPVKKSKTKMFFNKLFKSSKSKLNEKIELHTCEIKSHGSDKYIVSLLGDREVLEGKIRTFSSMAQQNNVNLLTFNYRGRGDSTGRAKTIDDIVNDSILQVKNLLAKGVPAKNIGIYGKCFGGAVATKVTEYFHKKGNKVHLFADRTFKSMTDVFMGIQFNPEKKAKYKKKGFFKSKLYTILEKLAPFFVKLGLNISNWEIDVVKAYKNIPEEYKTYINIKVPKKDREGKFVFEDGLVENKASLHEGLKKESKKEKELIKQALKEVQSRKKYITRNYKRRDLIQEKEYLEKLEKQLIIGLDKIKERKMHGFDNVEKITVEELYKRNPKIHRIEELRAALILHDQLFDALEKIQNPTTPNLTDKMREKGKEEIKSALIAIGSQIAGKDITNNGEYDIPNDMKTYIQESMITIDNQLEELVKDVTNDAEINIEKKLFAPVEDKKITNQLPHFCDLNKLKSRATTREVNAENIFNEWVSKIGSKEPMSKGDLLIDNRKDILKSRVKESGVSDRNYNHNYNKENPTKLIEKENNGFTTKALEPKSVFSKDNIEYPLRNARDYALLYGSLAGSAVLFSAAVLQGTTPAAAITGYVSVGLMGVGTASGVAYRAMNLGEVREDYEQPGDNRKIDVLTVPLKERIKLEKRLDEFNKNQNELNCKRETKGKEQGEDSLKNKDKGQMQKNEKKKIEEKMLRPKDKSVGTEIGF